MKTIFLSALIVLSFLTGARADERPGSLDPTWKSALGLTANELARAWPNSVIPLADGKLFAVVDIYDSEFNYIEKMRLVRLNPDASLDPGFPAREIGPSAPGNTLFSANFLPLPDGGLLITMTEGTGGFWAYQSVHAWLRADGSINESFPMFTNDVGYGVSAVVQPDGKLLVYCGIGTLVGGDPWPSFSRLLPDGSRDESFQPVSDIIGNLDFRFWLLTDGSVLLGAWSGVGGTYQMRRLTSSGAPDPTFEQPPNLLDAGTSYNFYPLSDRQVLNCSYPELRRLRQDGSIDPNFSGVATPRSLAGRGLGVRQVRELEGGRLLLSGEFTKYNGVTVNGIVRILSDGAIDPEFRSGQGIERKNDSFPPYFRIFDLSGGRFVVGGDYDHYDGDPVTPPIVLNADGTRDTTFVAPGSGVTSVAPVAVVGDQILVWTADGLGRLVPPSLPAAAAPPRVIAIQRDGEAVRLIVAVQSGRRYTLESSPDLAQWHSTGSQTAVTSELEFTDTPPAGTTERYYRVAAE